MGRLQAQTFPTCSHFTSPPTHACGRRASTSGEVTLEKEMRGGGRVHAPVAACAVRAVVMVRISAT